MPESSPASGEEHGKRQQDREWRYSSISPGWVIDDAVGEMVL